MLAFMKCLYSSIHHANCTHGLMGLGWQRHRSRPHGPPIVGVKPSKGRVQLLSPSKTAKNQACEESSLAYHGRQKTTTDLFPVFVFGCSDRLGPSLVKRCQ
jgi:hypothetical protein